MADTPIAQELRTAGLRATTQRIEILGLLKGEKHPVSVSEVARRVRADQVTAYRTLDAFEHAGLADRVDLHSDRAFFEYRDAAHHHHHVVCRSCGRIEDIHECDLESVTERIARTSRTFKEISSHSLEFFGTCTACAARS